MVLGSLRSPIYLPLTLPVSQSAHPALPTLPQPTYLHTLYLLMHTWYLLVYPILDKALLGLLIYLALALHCILLHLLRYLPSLLIVSTTRAFLSIFHNLMSKIQDFSQKAHPGSAHGHKHRHSHSHVFIFW